MKDKSTAATIYNIFIYIFVAFVIVICFFPFIYIIALSFSSPAAVINGKVTFLPVDFNLNSYIKIFNYPNFFQAYRNTLFYTSAGTAIALAMTLLFAYPLSKPFLYGRGIIMKLIIFSMFFSGGLIPNYLLVVNLKLANTIWAMLLPFAISQFNLIILINFLRALPEEIEEAAIIDGLSYFGVLIQMVIPLSLPAIATVGLYTAVFFWNDWFHGLIYLKTSQFPVMLFLRNIVSGASTVGDGAGSSDKTTIEITIKSAVIITTTLPIIILYPFLQRFFVKGLTIGSVKG